MLSVLVKVKYFSDVVIITTVDLGVAKVGVLMNGDGVMNIYSPFSSVLVFTNLWRKYLAL